MQNTEIMPRHETVMPPQSIFPIWIFFSLEMIHNLYCVISCLYCLGRCMRLPRSLPSSPHLLREISDSRAQTLVFARTKIWLENKLSFLPASSFSQDLRDCSQRKNRKSFVEDDMTNNMRRTRHTGVKQTRAFCKLETELENICQKCSRTHLKSQSGKNMDNLRNPLTD